MSIVSQLRNPTVLAQFLAHSNDEVLADGGSEAAKGLKRRLGAAALHAGDRRLGCAHSIGKLGLGQGCLRAQPARQGNSRILANHEPAPV